MTPLCALVGIPSLMCYTLDYILQAIPICTGPFYISSDEDDLFKTKVLVCGKRHTLYILVPYTHFALDISKKHFQAHEHV